MPPWIQNPENRALYCVTPFLDWRNMLIIEQNEVFFFHLYHGYSLSKRFQGLYHLWTMLQLVNYLDKLTFVPIKTDWKYHCIIRPFDLCPYKTVWMSVAASGIKASVCLIDQLLYYFSFYIFKLFSLFKVNLWASQTLTSILKFASSCHHPVLCSLLISLVWLALIKVRSSVRPKSEILPPPIPNQYPDFKPVILSFAIFIPIAS